MLWDLFTLLGVKLSHLAAGVAGGVVRAFLVGSGIYAAVSSVVTGALTAAYLTVPVTNAYTKATGISADMNFEHGVAFVVGLTAMLICEGLIAKVRTWSKKPNLGGGS
jgi:pilus assembly protein TadC